MIDTSNCATAGLGLAGPAGGVFPGPTGHVEVVLPGRRSVWLSGFLLVFSARLSSRRGVGMADRRLITLDDRRKITLLSDQSQTVSALRRVSLIERQNPLKGVRAIALSTLTVVAVITLTLTPGAAAAASPAGSPTVLLSAAPAVTETTPFAKRPRHVAGYTIHAKLRMSERDIGQREVENTVRHGPEGVLQKNGNWKIIEADMPFAVGINPDGWVVTVHDV